MGHPSDILGDSVYKVVNPLGGFFGFEPVEDMLFPKAPDKLRQPAVVKNTRQDASAGSVRANRAAQAAAQAAWSRSRTGGFNSTIATGPGGLNTTAKTGKNTLLGV